MPDFPVKTKTTKKVIDYLIQSKKNKSPVYKGKKGYSFQYVISGMGAEDSLHYGTIYTDKREYIEDLNYELKCLGEDQDLKHHEMTLELLDEIESSGELEPNDYYILTKGDKYSIFAMVCHKIK